MKRLPLVATAVLSAPVTAAALWAGYAALTLRTVVPERKVAEGVTYLCRKVAPGPGTGWAHITKTDLRSPNIDLFVSPIVHEGEAYPYELQAVDSVARARGLVVAMNGTLFGCLSDLNSKIQRPGDLAYSTETVISEGKISKGRLPVDVRMVCLDRDSGGWHGRWIDMRETKGADLDRAMSGALFGLAVQNSQLGAGKYEWAPDDIADRRSAIGLDPTGQLLYLAVFESATLKQVADTLKSEGASDVVCVDGGHSSALVVNQQVVTGNWRPVAVTIGVRAGR